MEKAIVIGILALVLGILIVLISVIFKKDTNKLEHEIKELLPGFDCGVCGFVSCEGMTKKVIEATSNIEKCKPIKKDKKEEIYKIFEE